MGKSKKNRINVVYSTNPDFDFEEESYEQPTIPLDKQKLYVSIDRRNRGGKSVTLVEGFVGLEVDANDLAKRIKQHCGVGGGYKNGELYIQGDQKKKVAIFLQNLGVSVKLKGG